MLPCGDIAAKRYETTAPKTVLDSIKRGEKSLRAIRKIDPVENETK